MCVEQRSSCVNISTIIITLIVVMVFVMPGQKPQPAGRPLV